MAALVRYDAACRALAAARDVDEVKDIRDKAEGMRAYARQAKNRELEVDAAEIRFRAERRLGEMMAADKAAGNSAQGRRTDLGCSETQVPTLADAGIDKNLAHRARSMAAVPEAEFEGMVGQWRERVSDETRRVETSLLRQGERARRDEALAKAPTEWPAGRYGFIYADPPWRYEHMISESREIENQYPTMALEEICALPVPEIAADDCMLYLWVTSPHLKQGLQVLDAWGFDYRTSLVWVKPSIGPGYYVRTRHELILVGRRGEAATPNGPDKPDSVIEAPRQAHSAKPPIVYDIIERAYPDVPKIELFCRAPRAGWAAWGNQAAA